MLSALITAVVFTLGKRDVLRRPLRLFCYYNLMYAELMLLMIPFFPQDVALTLYV